MQLATLADSWIQRVLLVVLRHPGCGRALITDLLGCRAEVLRALTTLVKTEIVCRGGGPGEDRAFYYADVGTQFLFMYLLEMSADQEFAYAAVMPSVEWTWPEPSA